MLTRKNPTALAINLTINGNGWKETFNVVYTPRTEEEIQDVIAAAAFTEKAKKDVQYANRQAVLFLVKEIESEYPLTDEGVAEMERDMPGIIEALFFGYHKARKVELAKN